MTLTVDDILAPGAINHVFPESGPHSFVMGRKADGDKIVIVVCLVRMVNMMNVKNILALRQSCGDTLWRDE